MRRHVAPRKMRPQSSVGFCEKCFRAQECGQSYVLYFYWRPGKQRNYDGAGTHFKISRRTRTRSRFRSISAHDEQKKNLSSDGLDTLRRSRSPMVLTASEEALVLVHDLDLFVTVQLLEETPAVLLLGKLCKRPRILLRVGQRSKTAVDQRGKTIVCKTDNFVPLVVPGLSTSSASNSSSTSTSQDLSSTSPGQERSDGLAPGNWCGSPPRNQNQNKQRDGNRDSDDRLRDLLEWLKEFTNNPEDTEVPAPAQISQDSDSERPTEVVSKSRKQRIYIPKRPKFRSLLANQNDKGSLQKTHWRSSTLSRIVDNGGSQSPQRGVWITEQSPVRCRCSIRAKHDLTGDGKEFTKVLRAVTQAKRDT